MCENKGKVTGSGDNIGGNIGYNGETGILEVCKNAGEVTGQNDVGGNIGYNDNKKINKKDIINTGRVNGRSFDTAKRIGNE